MRVFAAVDIGNLAKEITPVDSFGSLVTVIIKNAFVLAGIISFILLILGGFGIIVAGGDSKKLEGARGRMTGAIVGLILIVGSFWIVQIIEKITGLNILNLSL